MILKITSKDIMDLLETSTESIQSIKDSVNTIESELEKRIQVIKNIQEYALKEMYDLTDSFNSGISSSVEDINILTRSELYGIYDIYGTCVQPKLLKTPTDIFNFGSVAGKIFKNNANVKIADVIKESYKNMLMHDSINGKSITFEELDVPDVKIEIEINPNDLLGATSFNTIEILPYIPGSFDITDVKIYTMQEYQTHTSTADLHITNTIPRISAERILLDKSRDLWKIEFTVHIRFQNSNGKYPFGLKHLYFLNNNLNPNSNIVFKVSKSDYIDWISEDIIIQDQNGIYETTCSDENIRLYIDYTNGVFSYEIATSKGLTQNSIPRNIKEFWVSMPLDRSIRSIKFKKIAKRV